MKRILLLIGAVLFIGGTAFGQVNENFDTNFGSSYGDYTNIGANSDFDLVNGLSESGNSRSGRAVRFRNTLTPSLTYTGADDAGKDNGLGTVSFWYRHWDGDTSEPSFVVEYSTNAGGDWTAIGTEVTVTSTTYTEFTNSVNVLGDNILVRIRVTNTAERIIIDDFSITDYSSSPTITSITSSIDGLNYVEDAGPSSEQSFKLSGTNLEADISIAGTTNFEISTATGESFSATNPITLSETDGSVAETDIYVRLKAGLTEATYNDTLVITSTNADTVRLALEGIVSAPLSFPYTNAFGDTDDLDAAVTLGFTIDYSAQTSYLKLANGEYIETPTIDFTEYDALDVSYRLTTFGGSTGQEFSTLVSDDNGATYDTLATYSVPGSYTTFTTQIDLTGDYNVATGKIKMVMTGGSNSTRLQDLSIEESYVVSITGTEGWRLVSSPVSGVTFDDLFGDLWTQGFTGSDETAGTSNLYTYDETVTTGDKDSGFTSVSNQSTATASATGYAMYVYSDDNGPVEEGDAGFPKSIVVSGDAPSANVGPVSFTFSSSGTGTEDGWNLTGNPFGSAINVDDLGFAAEADLNNFVYVYRNGAYSPLDASGTVNTDTVAVGEGFFVKVDDAVSYTFPIAAAPKVASFESYAVKFSLEKEDLISKASVRFHEKAEFGVEAYDAYYMKSMESDYIGLSSTVENTKLSVNSYPLEINGSINVPFDISGTKTGAFVLSWEAPEGLEKGWSYQLIDNVTNETINLIDKGRYEFTFEGTASNRFNVVAVAGASVGTEISTEPTKFGLEQNYPNPFNPSTTINYSVENAGAVNISVYNLMGQKVAELVNETKAQGSYNVTWNASGAASGMYYYRLEAGGQSLTRKMTLIK